VNQATEVYSREFDSIFLGLPPLVQARIQARLRELGRHLEDRLVTAAMFTAPETRTALGPTAHRHTSS
jgi:hypothetical protein